MTFLKRYYLILPGKIPALPRFSGSFTNDGTYTLLSTEQENIKSIYRINLKNGEIRIVHTQDSGSISHPLINPVYPDIISFVPGPDRQNDMNLPMELRARTWKTDLGKNETRQFLTCGYRLRATHESWAYNGTRFFYFRKTVPGWKPVAVCSMSLDGTDFIMHYSSDSLKLGHGIASRDGRWFVSDTQDPGKNPLVLINLKTGTGRIIAWPNSSVMEGQGVFSHVHPFFSPSARYICYTTDASGYPQVHVVPVNDIVTCY